MNKYHYGFTLFELLIVLAVSAMLFMLAVPCYQNIVGRTQLRVAAAQLSHAVALAKRHALREGRRVSLIPESNGWQAGQRIIREHDHQVLAVLPALQVGVQWHGNLGQSDTIRFEGNGLPEGEWGSFWLQSHGLSQRLIMNGVGRLH